MGDERRRDMWTVKEVAEEAGLSTARIRQLLLSNDPQLKGRKVAGVWLIPDANVQRWLEQRRQ
jgi:hypothetical protein